MLGKRNELVGKFRFEVYFGPGDSVTSSPHGNRNDCYARMLDLRAAKGATGCELFYYVAGIGWTIAG